MDSIFLKDKDVGLQELLGMITFEAEDNAWCKRRHHKFVFHKLELKEHNQDLEFGQKIVKENCNRFIVYYELNHHDE